MMWKMCHSWNVEITVKITKSIFLNMYMASKGVNTGHQIGQASIITC